MVTKEVREELNHDLAQGLESKATEKFLFYLPKRGMKRYDEFLQVLREKQPFLVKHFGKVYLIKFNCTHACISLKITVNVTCQY